MDQIVKRDKIMMYLFYLLAKIAFAIATASIYMAQIKVFPVKWLYYHYFVRKPIVWVILVGSIARASGITLQTSVFPKWILIPLALMGLAVILTYKMHQ